MGVRGEEDWHGVIVEEKLVKDGGSLERGGSGISGGIGAGRGRVEGSGGGGGSRRLADARSEAWRRGGVGGAGPSPLMGCCFSILSVLPGGLLGGSLGGSGGGVGNATSLLIFSTDGTGRSFFSANAGGSDREPFTEQVEFSDALVFLRTGNGGAVLVRLAGREGGAPRLESPREAKTEGGVLGSAAASSPRHFFWGKQGAVRPIGVQETPLEPICDFGGTRGGVRGEAWFLSAWRLS